MSALAHAPARERGPTLLDPVEGGPTLNELLVDAWEGLASHRVVRCAVCAEEMEPEYGAHASPIAGRCGSCGSRLS